MSGESKNPVIMEMGEITHIIKVTNFDDLPQAKDIELRFLKNDTGLPARDKSFELCEPTQVLSQQHPEIKVRINTQWLEPGLYKFEAKKNGVTLENETFSYHPENCYGHGLWHLPGYEVEICGNNQEMIIELGCVGPKCIHIIGGVLKYKDEIIGKLKTPIDISNRENEYFNKKAIKVEIFSNFVTAQENSLSCSLEIEYHEKGGEKIISRMEMGIYFKYISFEKINFEKVYLRERGLKKMPLKQQNSVLGIPEVCSKNHTSCFFISYERCDLIDTIKGDDFEERFPCTHDLSSYPYKAANSDQEGEDLYLDQAKGYLYKEIRSKNRRDLYRVKPYLNLDLSLLEEIASPYTIIIKDKFNDAEGNLLVEWELISDPIDEKPEFKLTRKPLSWYGELTISLTKNANRHDSTSQGNKIFCLESSCSMIGRISGEECSASKDEIFKLTVNLRLWPQWKKKWFKDSKIRIFSSAPEGDPTEYSLDKLQISNTWPATLTHPTVLCLLLFMVLGLAFYQRNLPPKIMVCNIFGIEYKATVSVDDLPLGQTPVSILVGPKNHVVVKNGSNELSLPWDKIVQTEGNICLDYVYKENNK